MISNKKKHFYFVIILNKFPKKLIYHSFSKLNVGDVVEVKVKNSKKEALIWEETKEPEFETLEICTLKEEFFFDSFQIKCAKFISTYYFASISDAISLFKPYSKKKVLFEDFQLLSPLPKLSKAQQKAFEELDNKKKALLFGVTGSGKSEIYITKIAKTLKEGKNVIFLMPEISLTPQMEERLKKYFGEAVGLWHSKLSQKNKKEILQKILDGKIRVLAGARSALFAPIKNIGLIIVDEEHDDSYKSQKRPRYNAKDLALYFAKELNATVWLGSATPTLNSYIKLPVVRLKESFFKTKKEYRFISGDGIDEVILNYLKQNLKNKNQSLLFIPTRANFKYLYCPSCGNTHKCPYCSVGMSLDRKRRALRCHYCNFTQPIQQRCQKCGYSPLTTFRIGTQEAIEIIKEAIPNIKIEQFDKDSITTYTKLKNALKRISKKEVDLIVGTQMLSKGHDYADITLSIITGLDYILGVPDYRARERAIALLHQIAGRSGRFKDAIVLIQTRQKEQFLPYLKDYELFLEDEKEFAKEFYPPFMKLARVLIANKDEKKAQKITQNLVEELKNFLDIEIVGYGKAPIEKIANKFRYTILLRAQKATFLLKALYSLNLEDVEIDMDPIDFS